MYSAQLFEDAYIIPYIASNALVVRFKHVRGIVQYMYLYCKLNMVM